MKSFPDLHALGFTAREIALFRSASTPAKVQDFVDTIPANFEENGETCYGVLATLRNKRAHCMEGALVAALALWMHGDPPLLLDLKADGKDSDHVVALFKRHGRWGAISKANRGVLRYRDPIYKTLRELSLSYFHEYFDEKKEKSLRAYSRAFDLRKLPPNEWITAIECWDLAARLDDLRHYPLLTKRMAKNLRSPTKTEKKSWDVMEYERSRN